MNIKRLFLQLLIAGLLIIPTGAMAAESADKQPLMIEEQGSFAVGGKVITTPGTFDPMNPLPPDGQTFHGDHAYVFYQKPVNARKYPLIFLHGHAQFTKTWETTVDGREGFQNIFLRRGFPVYLVDQPRRGNAGKSTVAMNLEPTAEEQRWFGQFRLGHWPNYHPGVQFPQDKESLNQFFRQVTPNTGPYDAEVISDPMAALFEKVGDSVFILHSQAGGPGWLTAMKTDKVKGIVAYETGSGSVFPKGELPDPIQTNYGPVTGVEVPMEDFLKLTKIPILIVYGDFIPDKPVQHPGDDLWRGLKIITEKWVETINRHGGDAKFVYLPDIGIKGNTHFPFSDLNNMEIADHLSAWLKEKKLD